MNNRRYLVLVTGSNLTIEVTAHSADQAMDKAMKTYKRSKKNIKAKVLLRRDPE